MKSLRQKQVILAAGVLILFSFLLLPNRAFAAKSVTLSSDKTTLKIGESLQVRINIDTGGEKVGAVGFNINFSTEMLEGLLPSQSGSVFPMCATLTATRYECGVSGQDGFSGQGLVTTLNFKGRAEGNVPISLQNFQARFGPTGALVSGFSVDGYSLTVAGRVGVSDGTGTSGTGTGTSTTTGTSGSGSTSSSTGSSGESASSAQTVTVPTPPTVDNEPSATIPPSSSSTEPTLGTGEVSGSEPQVLGLKGASQEDPLKPAVVTETTDAEVVKGVFTNSPANFGFISTFLLLLLAGYLATKLHFTEKRRILEIEHLFETQLGAIGALESKIDLFDQKGGGGKERFMQELEQVKTQIQSEIETKLNSKQKETAAKDSENKAK